MAGDPFRTVGSVDDVPPAGIRAFDVDGRVLAVAEWEGAYYAFEDTCPHAECSFEEDGRVEDGASVTCMCHFSEFDLGTGEVLGGPARRALACYPVRVEGDDLQVALPEDPAAH